MPGYRPLFISALLQRPSASTPAGHRSIALMLRRGAVATIGAASLAVVAAPAGAAQPDPTAASPGLSAGPKAGGASQCDPQEAISAANEVPDERTATRRVYRHPCGGMVAQVSPQAESFKDAAGRWQQIDNRLVRAGGRYRNRASSTTVSLPESQGDWTTVAQDGHSVAFTLQGAGGSVAKVDGAQASYRDVFTGTDVRYEVMEGGVKEDIVLADDQAPLSYTYRLKLSAGLTATAEKRGGISIKSADGSRVAAIAAPFMLDAATVPARSDAVETTLTKFDGGYEMRLTADRAWVAKHLKKGPVTIDPTVSFYPADPDCEIADGSSANTNYCTTSTMGVGVDAGTLAKRRALLRFTIRRWLPQGSTIYSARLSLKNAALPSSPTSVGVFDATRKWDYGVTWNRWTSALAWTTPGGDFNSTAISTNTQVGDQVGAWEDWGVTAAVQRWADSGDTDGGNGFLLKQTNETSAQGAATFVSSNTANSSDFPNLFIWYDNMTGQLPYSTFSQQQQLTDRLSMGVNVAGGNLLLSQRDLSVAGTGQSFTFDRYYNSREALGSRMGTGWSHNLGTEEHLYQGGTGNAQYRGPSDYLVQFAYQAGGTFAKPPNLDADLVKNTDGTYTMTFRGSGQVKRFDTRGYIIEQSDRNGNKISVAYNANYEGTTITDTQGRVATLTNVTTRERAITDSTGRSVNYGYTNDAITSATDTDGKVTTYEYTGDQLTAVKDPRGNRTVFTYDADRRVTSVTRAGQTTTYAYAQGATGCPDALNTVVTDARGKKTTYCWQKPGRVTRVIDANGNSRSATYNASSKILTQSSGASGGPTATNSYDASTGNLTTNTQPAGEASSLTYGDPANPYSPTQATNAQGTETNIGYDAKGNTTSVRDGASPTATQAALEYNGQTGGVCPASGPAGTLRCAIDGKSNQTRYGYDAKGNLTTITPPIPIGVTTRTYDALSRVKTIRDANAKTRTYTYDAMDRVTKVDYSNGNTVSYSYDVNGNLTSRVDSVTGTTSYTYDAANNRTKDTLPGGATTDYTYDQVNNLKTLTDRTGTVTYGYDNVNNLASITEPDNAQTVFGYDTRDNRTSTVFPNGVTEARTYDSSDKLLTIRAAKGTDPPLTSYTYTYVDATSRQTQLQQTVIDKDDQKAAYTYDGLDRLTRELKTTSTGTVWTDRGYGYDAAGNRTTATNGAATTSYAYNAANQLCWKIDSASSNNCTSPPTGALTYGYDPEGNLTGASNTSALTYNARNQTATIRDTANNTDTHTYAGTGQEDLLSSGARSFQNNQLGFGVQDGGQYGRMDVIREPSGRLFSTLEAGRRHYFLTDSRDSVTGLANTSGTSGGYFKYDPFGTLIANTGQNVQNYFWFEGSARFCLASSYPHTLARWEWRGELL